MIQFMATGFRSYEARRKRADERAIDAIRRGDYPVAAMAVADAARYHGAAEELRYVIEAMGDENDTD
jgi:phage shock protein A